MLDYLRLHPSKAQTAIRCDNRMAQRASAGQQQRQHKQSYPILHRPMHADTRAALASKSILVCMDGNGANFTKDLPRLVGPVARDEADFVIGSRTRGEREPGSMLASQVFAAFLMCKLTKIFYGFRYTDI